MSFGEGYPASRVLESEGFEVFKAENYSSQEELDRTVIESLEEGKLVGIEPDGVYGRKDYRKNVSARQAVMNARREYRKPLSEGLRDLFIGSRSWTSLLSPPGEVSIEDQSEEWVLLSRN